MEVLGLPYWQEDFRHDVVILPWVVMPGALFLGKSCRNAAKFVGKICIFEAEFVGKSCKNMKDPL